MNWRIVLAAILVLAIFALAQKAFGQETDKYDGYWWSGIEQDLALSPEYADDPNVKAAAKAFRSAFLQGYFNGLADLRSSYNVLLSLDSVDSSLKNIIRSIGSPYDDLYGFTYDQYVSGLDEFYVDYKNKLIPVSTAVTLVAMLLRGESEEEVAFWTRYLRADDQTRFKMLREQHQKFQSRELPPLPAKK